MIVDSIVSFEKYVTLHESFRKVLDFLKKNDLHSLNAGNHVIEENNVWCTVSEQDAREMDASAKLEVHDSFIDIHVVLEGTEIIGFRDRAKCSGDNVRYDEKNDVAFMEEEPEAYVSYTPDNFVICFPQDCHMPLLGQGKIKKAIFKVRV